MADEQRLQIVVDVNGRRGAFGDTQSAWLQDQGVVERRGYESTGPATGIDYWQIVDDRTVDQIEALVREQPELRECDFCSHLPAAWQIALQRPIQVRVVPGPIKRPIFVCDDCVPMVRSSDKDGLTRRRIDSAIAQVAAQGGEVAEQVVALPPEVVRKQLAPLIREFVDAVIANRDGYPTRADAD